MSKEKEEIKCIGCRIVGGPLCIGLGLAFQLKNKPYANSTALAKIAFYSLPAGLYLSGLFCTYSLYRMITQ